jgi:4-hydroxy-3-methylbut-2-en-1-yl diphosphate synthase IspG/GcpE
MVGNVKLGSEHPIVRQTMTTSDTRDVEATVAEVRPLHALSYLQDTVCAVTK